MANEKRQGTRSLIVIGAGLMQIPLLEAAGRLRVRRIAFDMDANAPGMALAERQVVMSTRDIEGCVREARKLARVTPVHGVLTAGTDATRAVAAIAAALELPGMRYADAEASTNKVLMRRRLREHGLPVPRFYSVWSLKEAREALYDIGLPAVLKPSENMGSRGVIKISEHREMQAAFKHARHYSPTGEMILEEFMEGPELSVDALVWQGYKRVTGVADRRIEREPYFVEIGHDLPSRVGPETLAEVERVMFGAMDALGIHNGAAKGDIKITPNGVRIGEIGARLSGGFMSSHTYPLQSGVDLLQAAVQIAMGDEPELPSEQVGRVAIERGILVPPGKVLAVSGVEAMQAVPGVAAVYITRAVGDIIPAATSNLDKLGHIIAVGESLEVAEAAVARARDLLRVDLDESYGVDRGEVERVARERFGDRICWVCKACDGANCASGVPGMGGLGKMTTFRDNSVALAELRIVPRYIREPVLADTTLELFGRKLELPIMGAPMTGAGTNMGNAVTEASLANVLLSGCRAAGTVAWLGDGASPDKYKTMIAALEEADGFGVLICKPRDESAAIRLRFREAERVGALAVGIDVDAVSFKTLTLRGQKGRARKADGLRRIRDATGLPFIVKGIMSVEDAELALEAGADCIVVSNHGGRVLDDMPGTARVLPAIAATVGSRATVLADGGVRSGRDVFKMLALGARGVLVGRPLVIQAVGGQAPAVRADLVRMGTELSKSMELCGCAGLDEVGARQVMHTGPDDAARHLSPSSD